MYVTLKEIAKKANVSEATVSLALRPASARKYNLSEKTVKHIRILARKMGYKPNHVAASLRTQKTKTIGIIVNYFDSLYLTQVMKGFNEMLYPFYDCLVAVHNNDSETEKRHLDTLMGKRVDGVLAAYSGGKKSVKAYSEIAETGVPLVLLDSGIKGVDLPVVRCDHYDGAYQATKSLIELGHRRIQFVLMQTRQEIDEKREQGYLDAMRECGLESNSKVVQKPQITSLDENDITIAAEEILDNWIQSEVKSTAMLMSHDYLAYEVLAKAEYGHFMKIPEDLSLMGIGDRFASRLPRVGLSSVTGDYTELGRQAAKLLLHIINGEPWDGREAVMPVHIRLRKTTCALRSGA